MARLAEIKDATTGLGQHPKAIYVNPLHVISVESVANGARIVLSGGQTVQTTLAIVRVVEAIQQASL
jgi:hypothetical protein